MFWNVSTIVPFITFFLYAALLVLVVVARPQTEPRRRFRWFLLTMTLWSLSAFLLLVDTNQATLWLRMVSSSAIAVMVSTYYFVDTILESKTRLSRYVIYYGIISITLCLFTNLVIVEAHVNNSVVEYTFGTMLYFISGPSYLLLIYSIYRLIDGYRHSEDVNQRNRLLYLSAALSLIIIVSPINFTPLGKYPVDIAANGLSALIIAYSILRYQLLDIRVVIRQGMVYSIPTVIIGATYFLIITLSLNLFNLYSGLEIFLLSLGVSIISALLAEPFRNQAQTWIDRLFFREKYDSTRMLQNLSGNVATVLDLYKITEMILKEVCSTLHIPTAAFFLRDENSNRFQLITEIGHDRVSQIEFRQGHPVVLWLSSHDQPLSRYSIEVLPQFQSLWRSEREDLDSLNAELFIPIKVQDILVGIFLVGSKRSEQAYTMEDIVTLTTVANQTAVAIENARLYTSEQTRLREMDTLYNMARQLVTTENLNEVVAVVAEHAVNSVDVDYARILTKTTDGDYICRAIHPHTIPLQNYGDGKKEPLVAEHYYNWILQEDQAVVIQHSDPTLHPEEKSALFFENSQTVCLSPLKGVDEYIGLLLLGAKGDGNSDSFSAATLRLVNVISDYAASAIQRALLHERLEETFLETIVALANAVDARDSYTGDHSQRMADLSTTIGQVLDLEAKQIEALHWASILHDIGKIGVPDEILNKKGPLTKEEWVVMKEHPVIGSQIVSPIKYLAPVSPIIRAHHEKYDGSGYPYGLAGEEIPLGARILAVVDAYIAIRDKRVYSSSHTHEEAIAELRRSSGSHFDPQIVDVFCKTITP
jgi:HD-GYP domain-containing protein (c-di-GMP phosphodiesterase class II)